MNAKRSPSKDQPSKSAKTQSQQSRARRKRTRGVRGARGPNWTLWVVIGLVVVVGGALLIASVSSKNSGSSASSRQPAPKSLVDKVTSVPDSVANAVGQGTAKLPVKIQAPADTSGKPVVTYVGAEYCPYCAGERWAMVLALSRFGTFQNLSTTHSSSNDVYPDTQTFSFHGSSYSSPYISFEPVELQTNQLSGATYGTLDTPTAQQQQLLDSIDGPPYFASKGAIPFVDFGGRFALSGASYDVSLLQGKSASEIASALHDPSSPIAKGIVGTANAITAAICAATNDQPASACSIPAVKAIGTQLG